MVSRYIVQTHSFFICRLGYLAQNMWRYFAPVLPLLCTTRYETITSYIKRASSEGGAITTARDITIDLSLSTYGEEYAKNLSGWLPDDDLAIYTSTPGRVLDTLKHVMAKPTQK